MAIRIVSSLILLFSALFLPFWFTFSLAVALLFYFKFYFEAPAIMLLSDAIYGTSELRYFGATFVSLVLTLLILVLVELMKKMLKFYPK